MTKKEFSELVEKVISSNSSDSAKYARELRNKLVHTQSVRRKLSSSQVCDATLRGKTPIIAEPDDVITIGKQSYLVTFPHPYIAKLEPCDSNGKPTTFME